MGHDFPAPRAALEFLYQFYEEQKIEEAKRRRVPDEIAYIPDESVELQGLGRVNRSLVQELGSRCAGQRMATVDQDATIIESRKQEALRTSEGERGYQPTLAVWAEMDVVLADQFADGKAGLGTLISAEAQGGYARHGPSAQTSYAPNPVSTAFDDLISELGLAPWVDM